MSDPLQQRLDTLLRQYSNREAARRIGVHPRTLQKWRAGSQSPSTQHARKITRVSAGVKGWQARTAGPRSSEQRQIPLAGGESIDETRHYFDKLPNFHQVQRLHHEGQRTLRIGARIKSGDREQGVSSRTWEIPAVPEGLREVYDRAIQDLDEALDGYDIPGGIKAANVLGAVLILQEI